MFQWWMHGEQKTSSPAASAKNVEKAVLQTCLEVRQLGFAIVPA